MTESVPEKHPCFFFLDQRKTLRRKQTFNSCRRRKCVMSMLLFVVSRSFKDSIKDMATKLKPLEIFQICICLRAFVQAEQSTLG